MTTPLYRHAVDEIRRERNFAIVTAVVVFLLFIALGCASTLSDATRYADKSMAVVDVIANKGARLYQEATLAAINVCRAELGDTSTPEKREACLRRKGFAPDQVAQVREAYEALARAYDDIASALDEIREAAPVLEQSDEAAEEALR